MRTILFPLAALALVAAALPANASHTSCTNERQDVNLADLGGVDTGLPDQGGLTVCVLDKAVATNLFTYPPVRYPPTLPTSIYGSYGATVNPQTCNGYSCTSHHHTTGVIVTLKSTGGPVCVGGECPWFTVLVIP